MKKLRKAPSEPHADAIEAPALAELLVDLWRIESRAQRASDNSVLMACERAMDRVRSIGFSLETMVGEPYHENLAVRVVDHEGGATNPTIAECLSPVVYFRGRMVRPGEVVTKGAD